MKKVLFQYAVIKQAKEDDKGNEIEAASVIVEPTIVLAQDVGQANLIAGRAIPESELANLDRLDVVVRPF